MIYVVIPIHSRTASFRDPEFQNYHRTLRLPPPATCIGLAGAALGLSAADAQAFFTEGEWEVGIGGSSDGLARDLWKFDDFKTGSIIIREFLYGNRFVLAFGHENEALVERLAAAFRRPHYALSCGSSDSICLVDVAGMRLVQEVEEVVELENCYTDGDIIAESLSLATTDKTVSFSIRTTSIPVAQDLPVRFTYNPKNGTRILRQRRRLSLVRHPVRLPQPIRALQLSDHDPSNRSATPYLPLFPL